jgi:hypothetical protein
VAIWGRNVLTPTAGGGFGSHVVIWFLREMLLIGGWTEDSTNGHAAWTSALNVLATVAAGPSGLEVEAAEPRIVYSPSGIFTSGMVGAVLSLFASEDQNRGMWKIVTYIDANHVEVDANSFYPAGWVDEDSMEARITVGNGLVLGDGSWSLMVAPAGSNLHARLIHTDTSNANVGVRPKGKLGSTTEVGASNNLAYYYTSKMRLNFCFDGFQALMYWVEDYNKYIALCQIGELVDVDASDTDPGFFYGVYNASTLLPWNIPLRMLDGAATPAQITAYPTSVKNRLSDSAASSLETKFGRRLVNGRPGYAAIRSPWVCLGNTVNVGACVRGRLPLTRFSYTGWEKLAPINTAGDWYHLNNGLVVPRNGPNDPMVLYP